MNDAGKIAMTFWLSSLSRASAASKRAAAKLGVSQPAFSHTIRGLEARGCWLEPTRSVAAPEAGERLFKAPGPHFDEIKGDLAGLSELRDKLAGTIRITAGEHSADTIFWPALAKLLPRCRDTNVEPIIDNGLTDIVAERYDVGVGLDAQVAKDMEGRSWHLCRPRAFLRLTRKFSTTS